MKWSLFRRRRPKRDVAGQGSTDVAVAVQPATIISRAKVTTGSLAQSAQLRDEALRFARDYQLALGAKVRVEGPDLVSATRPDGTLTRYTSSLARARSGQDVELLAPGGETLATLIEDVETRASVAAFRLEEAYDEIETLRRLAPALQDIAALPDEYEIDSAEDALTIECAFEIHARWRGGVSHDWVTLAFDARTLQPIPVVADETLARAGAVPLPSNPVERFERANAAAQDSLGPTLGAIGRWLRLRSANEFAARQDELRQTADRLIREAPEDASIHRLAFERESQRVRDLFAVSVEASLRRVAFIASPARLARPKGSASGPALQVDLGRGTVRAIDRGAPPTAARRSPVDPNTSPLAVSDLTLLPDRVWREAALWLLEQSGNVIERVVETAKTLHIDTSLDQHHTTVIALRGETDAALRVADVLNVLAGRADPRRRRVLFTPSAVSDDARAAIRRADVTLIGPDTLQPEIQRLSNAYSDQQAVSTEQAEALARQASETRSHVLASIESLESVLAQAANTRRASGAQIATAAGELREVWMLADQVFVAWDTLLADWQALFPERAARDGSLRLLGDQARLAELRERAEHLVGVTRSGFARVTETPGVGEMGYTAWRRALLEELTARCESMRWRIRATDPSQWRDFAEVSDTQAMERAETGRTSALHARARAEKAYAQLATRARLA